MVNSGTISKEQILSILAEVMDPEVPVLSITDLGIVRDIHICETATGDPSIEVVITPTYSGCPAMDVIAITIKMELLAKGFQQVAVRQTLSPAWTTDWMTENGKQKLKAYGIAPPNVMASVCSPDLFAAEDAVQCPHCNSHHTHRISEFGSTACKALYQCDDCQEPFDYFKCH